MKKQLFCVALMAGALTACGPGVPQLGKASIDEVITKWNYEIRKQQSGTWCCRYHICD